MLMYILGQRLFSAREKKGGSVMAPETPVSLMEKSEETALALRQLYAAYGYTPYKMSKFEPYDLYAQNRSFVTGDHILTFTDTDGRLMALKPDVTLSVIKHYRGGQQKICYHENVYRDTGASHEFREIPQSGLECIGEIDLYTQLEVLTLAAESLRRISDRAILDLASVSWISGLLSATQADHAAEKRLMRLLHEKNAHGIRALCEESGVPKAAAAVWQALAALYGPVNEALPRIKSLCLNEEMEAAYTALSSLCGMLEEHPGVEVNLDFSILSDLKYYNGLVFKGYVPGVHAGILSGGQYGNLVKRLGKQAGAIGFAVYLDMLSQLPAARRPLDADVLLLYDNKTSPLLAARKAQSLREQGLRVRVQKEAGEGRYGQIIRMEGGEEA